MAGISIDRLTLQVPGLSPAAARSLALAVANQLAAAGRVAMAEAMPVMRVDLVADADTDPGRLATQLVSEVMRQLQSST